MNTPRAVLIAAFSALLSACASVGDGLQRGADGISDVFYSLDTRTRQDIAAAGLAYKIVKPAGADLLLFGLAYLVIDPLAPNWEISETRISEDTFHLRLAMKRHFSGGEGEALQVLKRRANQLKLELGYHGYRILDYSEGIESDTLAAWRIGEGRLQLTRRPANAAFRQQRQRKPPSAHSCRYRSGIQSSSISG
ncbi:MAG: hypothetical protein LBU11_00985 [Zoogloeaceae bacterium]|jgi:hypothetical protein|nr:hypothetical protein [Zoogloeaceae bacterium]